MKAFSMMGRIRGVPATIERSTYVLPISIELVVVERIDEIRPQEKDIVDIAIELCLYCMKTQAFTDGNKRASVIFSNHYLIAHGKGVIVISEKDVLEFKKLLVVFYEGEAIEVISSFMREQCWNYP